MKRIIGFLAVLAFAGLAHATTVTNYVPDGQFESPNGGVGPWANMFGGDGIYFLSTGGNPNGCLEIADSGSYGGIAYVNPPPFSGDTQPSLASLGLTAGQTYTFVMDMEIVSGSSIGGIKFESWTTNGIISNSGNLYPLSGTTSWATYTFSYTIAPGATYINVVPLWGPNSTVNYDNIGVVVPVPGTASVSITSPTNGSVVYSNFTMNASASANPGIVTNVAFYVDSTLIANVTNSPFGCSAVGISSGSHTLKAVAMDNIGNRATSSPVSITVTSAPIPAFGAYEPFNYTSLTAGTPVTGSGFTGNWSCGAAGTIVTGLTYPMLATADNALQSSGSYQLETLTIPASGSSTVWVSFLMQQAGDNGGNRDGFAVEDSAGNGVMFAYQQNGAAIGNPALTKISSFTGVGSQLSPYSGTAQTYANVNFYVLKLTYTGTSLSSVSVYSNPTAGQATAPAPDFTVSSGLSGIGLLDVVGMVHQATMQITVDEVNVGSTFADVVGANLHPTVPTSLSLSITPAEKVSWSGPDTNYYQPQNSSDGMNWNNLGNVLYGTNVTSVYDLSPEPFYQVEEIQPVIMEEIINSSFEQGDGFGGAAYWQSGGSELPVQVTTDAHTGSACVALFVTNATATAQTAVLEQNLQQVGSPGITGGNTYNFSFWAKSLGRNPAGGSITQYKVTWLDMNGAVAGGVGFNNFTGGNGTWTQTSTGAIVAPTNAVNALIEFYAATGSITNDFGGALIDDVSMPGSTPTGNITILTPTVQNAAVFSATVMSGGSPATAASGYVNFEINSALQSTGILSSAVATGTPTVVPSSYTLTGIYSGDATYIGSSSSQQVGGGVNPSPTDLMTTLSGNQLTLFWPSDHTGWTLQSQTNSLQTGLTSTWYNVPGSTTTNQVVVTISKTNPTVYFRMKY